MERIAWYRGIAPSYDLVCRPLYAGARGAAVRALGLREGQRVLDLGCGTGLALPGLARAVGERGEVVGVDGCGAMLARARRRSGGLPQVQLLQLDLRTLAPPRDREGADLPAPLREPFDALLCGLVLAVVEDWERVFEAAWGLLAPGGRCAVYDTRPLDRGLRWMNPFFVPLAGWTGQAALRRPTWQVLDARATGIARARRLGGFVHVTAGSKPQ